MAGPGRKRALRLFFATGIHGSDRCFRKFLAAAKVYEADALVLGGDIAGKGLVPIRSHNGSLSARVRGESVTVRSEEHTSELQSRFDLVCRLLLEKKKEK